MGLLFQQGYAKLSVRDVRNLFRESFELHKFNKKLAINLLKAVEVSFYLAEDRGIWQRCRHFSFIFDRSKLLSIGLNSKKTHPKNLKFSYLNKKKDVISDQIGTHSELSAILRLENENYKKLTLINTRINQKNQFDFSKPCEGCCQMILNFGIKDIYYTNKEGKFIKM